MSAYSHAELYQNGQTLKRFLAEVAEHRDPQRMRKDGGEIAHLTVQLHNVRTGETKLVRIGEMTRDDFLAYAEWQETLVAESEARDAATREVQ